jgi:hypothetical protein
MKKGLPGDRLRFVTGSYRRGGPLRCCTPDWISVASVQIDLARRLSEAIWHLLSRGEAFAPKGATDPLAARRPLRRCATGANSHRPCPPIEEAIER